MIAARIWARAHLGTAVALGVVAVGLVGFGVYWFAPQRLVLDRAVAEAPPAVSSMGSAPPAGSTDTPPPATAASGSEDGAESTTLADGAFRSLEHDTRGRAVVLELADGRRFLRLMDLDTSNGPDLRVYLTDQPLSDDWFVWDDGEVVDLGSLKGNVGSSNYEIPDDVNLSRFPTAVVWCRRFTVGFGVAPLDAEG